MRKFLGLAARLRSLPTSIGRHRIENGSVHYTVDAILSRCAPTSWLGAL